MSLDLNRDSDVAYATGAPINSITGFVSTLFNANDIANSVNINKWLIKVTTAGGNVDLSGIAAPNTLSFIKDGDEVIFLKATPDNNRIVLNDSVAAITSPIPMALGANMNKFTGIGYSFVNLQGEAITLYADKTNNNWGIGF